MRYIYSTKPEGIEFVCEAISQQGKKKIVVTDRIKASCHIEAAQEFEESLAEKHEGFDWIISVLTDAEIKVNKESNVFCA